MADSPNSFFRALRILHGSLILGMLIFLAVSFFVVRTDALASNELQAYDRILQVVAVLISIIALVIGFRLFRNKILQIRNDTGSAVDRANQYRAACIIWWAMIEGPGIFAIICFTLTSNYAFFALGCFHVLILGVFMPKKENIIVLLNLNQKEVSELEG